jgi:hypothetical protein
MQLEELPECYQTDEPFDVKEVEDLVTGSWATSQEHGQLQRWSQ